MIEETASVVRTDGDFAWVETQRQSACGSCAGSKGCGTAALSKVLGKRRTEVRALNRAGARVGDRVIIGIEESALVRGSLAVYAVPLLVMLLGAGLGEALGRAPGADANSLSMGFGLIGLGLGFLWLRRFTRRASRDPRYQPVVLRRTGFVGASPDGILTPRSIL